MDKHFKTGFEKTAKLTGMVSSISNTVKSLTKVPKSQMPSLKKPRTMNYETHRLKTMGGMFGPGAGINVQ